MRAVEADLAARRIQVEDQGKEERLRQVALIEEGYQAQLSVLRSEWAAELENLQVEVEHKRQLAQHELQARVEEEAIRVRLLRPKLLAPRLLPHL